METKNANTPSPKKGPATMFHHPIAILTFFSHERLLSLTDNQTLIISRFVSLSLSLSFCSSRSLFLFSDRSSPLPHNTAFPSPSDCQRSPVIPFIFRCSLLTREFPWLRYPPGGWDQSCFCSLHLSLASSLFFTPFFLLLPSFRSSSALGRSCSRSSPFLRRGPVDWSGGRLQL